MLKLKKSTSFYGDALQVLKALPDNFFDACIVDPPYNMSKKKGLKWAFSSHVTMQENWDRFSGEEYYEFSVEWTKEMIRVVKPNGNLFVFGTYHNIYLQGIILEQFDRKILNSIIWVKPNAQPNITCRMLTESTEQIIWAANETKAKATNWTFNYALSKTLNEGKQLRNAWTIPVTPKSERVAGHPTQKPEILMERLILLFTNRGDWVLDPFAGVATTGVAALKHDRQCVLIEKHPKYFEAQKERIEKLNLGKKMNFCKFELPKKRLGSPKKLAPKKGVRSESAAAPA